MRALVRGLIFRSLHAEGSVVPAMVVGGVLCWLLMAAGTAGAVGDATSAPGESCPNESSPGFRSYLPDCRAYEQVTPVFKAGIRPQIAAISKDGATVFEESLGVYAGSESDTALHGSMYKLSRSSSGWSVAGASLPASEYPAQELLAASPELTDTLWLARAPSESLAAANFYVSESDGAVSEVGPLLPPTATGGPPAGESQGFLYGFNLKYAEASDDFSEVLFDLFGLRAKALPSWPGDTTTGERSLYEYSGRGLSHPELVGVDDGGQLISSCETYLGSQEETELYNAVSADGRRVFFTAAACSNHAEEPTVNELWARLGSFPIDTVPVSEPAFSACEECQTGVATAKHAAVSERSAEFAGASESGSNVFFLTNQELLPGATGENLYDYDFEDPEGHKVVRVSIGSSSPEVRGVARVSEDGSHVYFVAGGRLTKGPREGEDGKCLTELRPAEATAEKEAELQEENNEPVTAGARCRPEQGGDNLYVFERDATYPAGRVAFVGTLSSVSDGGAYGDWSPEDHRQVQATPDGRYLVFASGADLTPDDLAPAAHRQIFEYDAESEALVWVSRGASDYEPEGDESADGRGAAISAQGYASSNVSPAGGGTGVAVSSDGATLVFESAAALTANALPAAAAGASSVYEYHSTAGDGGTIGEGEVYLLSDGVDTFGSAGLRGLDEAGEDVFFTTADQLVPQDTDTQTDLYDARADGGFPAPDPPVGCEGCEVAPLVQFPVVEPAVTDGAGAGAAVSEGVSVSAGAVTSPHADAASHATLRARELARALRVCGAKAEPLRRRCDGLARTRYGPRRAVRAAKRDRAGRS